MAGSLAKLSDIDAVLVRYGDVLSPEMISFKIDGVLTPLQVRARIEALTNAPDWLTRAQQNQLNLLKMRQVIAELSEQTLTARNAEVILNGLDKVAARIDKLNETTEADLSKLYAFQGTAMLDAMRDALIHIRGAVIADFEAGIEVDDVRFDKHLESGLRFAQMTLAKHEADVPVESEQMALTS